MHDTAVTCGHDIFGLGVGQQLPWLAIFQRVVLRAIVAHSFEGPLPPLCSSGCAAMVRLGPLSRVAVPQQQCCRSAGRGGHPLCGLRLPASPLPVCPGLLIRAAARSWVQEDSYTGSGSMCAAGEGQLCRRNSTCAAHSQPSAWLQEAAWAWGCWHQILYRCCSPAPSQTPLDLLGPPQTKLQIFICAFPSLVHLCCGCFFCLFPLGVSLFLLMNKLELCVFLAVITPHALV